MSFQVRERVGDAATGGEGAATDTLAIGRDSDELSFIKRKNGRSDDGRRHE